MATIDSLPLFPLGLVLYPGERLPLHIFEERYKDLTHYCLDHDVAFGIVLIDEGSLADIGTTARIERIVKRYDDGRMDIVVEGEERFELRSVHDRKSYYTADVALLEDDPTLDPSLKERAITQHMKLLELAGRTVRPDVYDGVDRLSFMLAQNAGLDAEEKQKVLARNSENERVEYLIHHFESLIPKVEQEDDVRRRIQSNGHFKNFPPEEI